MEEVYRQAFIHLLTLPKTHVQETQIHLTHTTCNTITSKLSPMQKMARHCPDINPDRVEKIGHPKQGSMYVPVYSTIIAETCEASMANERNDTARYKIYTNGSAINGGVGAAALLYKADSTEPQATRHYHLGTTEQYTTYNTK